MCLFLGVEVTVEKLIIIIKMPREKKFFNDLCERQKKNVIKKTMESVTESGENSISTKTFGSKQSTSDDQKDDSSKVCTSLEQSSEMEVIDFYETDEVVTIEDKNKNQPTENQVFDIQPMNETCNSEEKPLGSLNSALSDWAIENSISHNSLNGLLQVLKQHTSMEKLPTDARTLLKTPRKNNSVVRVAPGFYNHFGILSGITRSIQKYYSPNLIPNNILFNINIDGLPLSKSSNSQFWPILGSIVVEGDSTDPFIIGLYHGYHKPENPNDFLQYFVNEMKELETSGIKLLGRKICVKLNAVICDSPARAYITCTKGHNAYFGCGKCTQEGEFVDGRVTFPEMKASLRTDASFKNRVQECYHKQDSALLKLNIGMISNIPLDYMHLCCLGVMKRIVQFWVKGSKNIRMSKDASCKASQMLLEMKQFIPKEFCRKPRSLEEVDRFKATEFRQLLLYTGMIIFKETLRSAQYVHFLCFCLAMRILVSREDHIRLNNYANSLLESFVKNYSKLYGEFSLSYNVHNLIHVCADVQKFGELDKFSAFKYENFMQNILKKVKSSNRPLQQVSNRIMEESQLPHNIKINEGNENFPSVIYKKTNGEIKYLGYAGFIINSSVPNNTCILHSGDVVCVKAISVINHEIQIKVEKYQEKGRPLFLQPCDSRNFGILVVNEEDERVSALVSDKDIKQKCLKLPLGNRKYAILPLIHQE